jgi:histidine triad (HIT) family protein
MSDCLFCQIANHQISSKTRFENEGFIAFDDINPKAKIHVLVIPKKHISSVAALDDSDSIMIGRLVMTAKEIASDAGLESFRLVFNSGLDAGQEVDHIHLHILGGNKLGTIA